MAKRGSKQAVLAEAVKDEGRFLCVENRTSEAWSFRHPDPQQNGMSDLYIEAYGTVVCNPLWLDVPYFINAVNDGHIRTFRTDVLPRKQDFDVPRDLDLTDPMLNRMSILIVSREEFNAQSRALISAVPEARGTDTPDREYLKGEFSKFLKNVEYREKRYRNRPEVLEAVNSRLQVIREM